MYFCGLCAYSTSGKAHLAIHAYLVHDIQPVPWHQHPGSAEHPISESETKSLVRPKEYICALSKDCRFKCLTTALFREHLEQCHWGFKLYVCHLCLAHADSSSKLLEHYRCDHAFFKVHCLYCDLGGDDDWVIMRHIMEKHAYNPFRLLLRNGDSDEVVKELRQLAVEYLTKEPVQPELLPQPLILASPQSEACSSESTQITPDIGGTALEEEIVEDNSTSANDNQHTVEMDKTPERNECVVQSCEHAQSENEVDRDRHTPSVTEIGFSTFPGKEQFFCNIENCSMEYGDVFDFMNHLDECHPLQSALNCPKCGSLVSVVDLLSHIVERHSGISFCPYNDCSFGSANQCDVDDHIIQMHQIYQDEQGKADQAVAARKAEFCPPNNISSTCYAEAEGCKDTVDFEPEACYENGKADEQCDVSQAESTDDLTTRRYFCDECSTDWGTVLSYIHHMTTAHTVLFFCGHCLKSYKKSRYLLVHAGCQHIGQPFSVLRLEDGKVVDVGMLVAPSWVDEAQHYLNGASRSRLKATGKTLIKNLKKAIDFVASTCVESEVEQPQCSAMPTHADGNWRRPSATQEIPGQHTEPLDDSTDPEDNDSLFEADGGPTLQDQALHEPLSSLGVHSDSTDQPSEESNIPTALPHALKGYGMASMIPSLQPQESISGKTPYTESRRIRRDKCRLKILASAFIDASSCKKVNGRIVIEEKVRQKLSELNTMHTSGKKLTEVPSSLLSGVHEGSHMCSECLITVTTFKELCKHIVETHGASTASDLDNAGSVVSLGYWAPQEFTSISSTFRSVRPFPDGHIRVEHSRNNVMLHLKQIKSKCFKRPTFTDNLFVRHLGVRVPYSQFASIRNLNPVIRLVRVPVIKQETQ